MNYIVFDLEWNQCPDGKERENREIPFEILEIGAIKLNEEKQEIGRFHEFIRPLVYSRLHYRTREIIHIDVHALAEADPFPKVLERFQAWCGEDVRYCTWGSLDLLELQRNIRYHKLENFFPFPLKYYDIQKIFSLACEDGKSRRTLEYAVDMLQIEKDIPFHEALSDAYYTALVIRRIPQEMLAYYSVDYFRVPLKRSEELHLVFDNYAKSVFRRFPSRSSLMRDRSVRSANCYLCGRSTSKKLPWFSCGSRHYRCLAYCEEHGWIKGKIRVKKTEDGAGYFAVKTLKQIPEERALELLARYQKKKKAKGA